MTKPNSFSLLPILLALFLLAGLPFGCGEEVIVNQNSGSDADLDGDLDGEGDGVDGDGITADGDGETPGDSDSDGDDTTGDGDGVGGGGNGNGVGDDGDGDGPPPDLTINAVIPSKGPLTGGTPFVVDGQGFTSNSIVLFDATTVPVDLIDGRLNGVTPLSDTTGPVTVRVFDDQTGEDLLVNGFEYVQPLRVTSAQPSLLNVEGGVEISLFGQGFTTDTRVTIGGRPVQRHTFLESTHLRVIVPPGEEGPADVRLTDRGSSFLSSNLVRYVAPMRIDLIEPPVGAASGGDEVTLQGSGFQANSDVFFGAVAATVLEISADGTSATVLTPPGLPGIVNVNIQSSDDGAILTDAFAYLGSTSTTPSLDGAFPRQGSTLGGEEVYLYGTFPGHQNFKVFFGAQEATILSSSEEVLVVTTPAAAEGEVDLRATDQGEELLLPDGFTYIGPLGLSDLTPGEGPATGGTSVTVTGVGFQNATQLTLGGLTVPFTVVNDETITFTTPEAAGGFADLVVRAGPSSSALLEEAFFFVAPLEIWSQTPTRGSTAGNTYVELQGTGFTAETLVTFGDIEATELTLLDPYTLALRTPRHPAAIVNVTASLGDQSSTSPEPYTFFNPGAPMGGTWGNPINGAVNVLVYTYSGAPVEDAFVMLSTNPQTPYMGVTNEMGMVTLSGPDVFGEQTITAAAADHSSTTVQRVNAENVTIFLHTEEDGDGAFPPPPPQAIFTGHIEGLDKLNRPNADQVLMAIVYSTRPSLRAQIPDPGGANVVLGDGTYTINTRVGELALVAIGGLYDNRTQEFIPDRMGVARYLTAADGQTYQLDIDLEIPLNRDFTFKFDRAPLASGGPDLNEAVLYLDLGVDGVFGPMAVYESDQELVSIDRVAALTGPIADASYTIMATSLNSQSPIEIPYSQTTRRNITNLNTMVSTAPMTSTVRFTSPASEGGVPPNGIVRWTLDGTHQPDFYYFFLVDPFTEEIVWEIFLPGTETSFVFPTFPDLASQGLTNLPLPYPGGSYVLVAIGINIPGTSANNFSYDLLNLNAFEAYSIHQYFIGLPSQ